MAKVDVGHHPELTVDQAIQLFRNHFGTKYEVYPTKLLRRDLVVKRSGWTAVGVKLEQQQNSTSFVFTAFIPSVLLQLFFGSLVAILILRSTWKNMEAEVQSFIEGASEFK